MIFIDILMCIKKKQIVPSFKIYLIQNAGPKLF